MAELLAPLIGIRRVSALQGWAGEKSAILSILLANQDVSAKADSGKYGYAEHRLFMFAHSHRCVANC